MSDKEQAITFTQLAIAKPVLQALNEIGYETPTPIQAAAIPHLLAGKDILGQAQTGTGKTAAFALPLLSRVDLAQKSPQILVLAPTRELALQVAEAFKTYARHLDGFQVLPIYGGQGMDPQLRALKRGVHVVVGTPGRVMDHMRRKSLSLGSLKTLVLDEADEMLNMGFLEDVEWILEHTPDERQIALFSATMPPQIAKVAKKYLKNAEEVRIKSKTQTVTTITQRYLQVVGKRKLDALTRILETEDTDATLIFARTKVATTELAEKLEARGYSCAALNGDINQDQRQKTVDRLKRGGLDIVIATDVAARGLDVERISHVINFDIPHDPEAYVHRIGRTGRAGRSGNAILFVAPREMRMLQVIERVTRQEIPMMKLPTGEAIKDRRVEQFKQKLIDASTKQDLGFFQELIAQLRTETELSIEDIAATLAYLNQKERPLQVKDLPKEQDFSGRNENYDRDSRDGRRGDRNNRGRDRDNNSRDRDRGRKFEKGNFDKPKFEKSNFDKQESDLKLVSYRLSVGRDHQATPKHIVGAIANEADINSRHIGDIKINDDHSTVELPEGLPKEKLAHLNTIWICNQRINLSLITGTARTRVKKDKKDRTDSKGKKAYSDRPILKSKGKSKDKAKPKSAQA